MFSGSGRECPARGPARSPKQPTSPTDGATKGSDPTTEGRANPIPRARHPASAEPERHRRQPLNRPNPIMHHVLLDTPENGFCRNRPNSQGGDLCGGTGPDNLPP